MALNFVAELVCRDGGMEKEIRRLDEHESKENTRRRWKEQGRNCLLLGISGPDFSQVI